MTSTTHLPSASTGSLQASTSEASSHLCLEFEGDNIVISRRTLIAAIAICGLFTCLSMLVVAALLYREWTRRRQVNAAKAWGRKSRFEHRISIMRKEIDGEYSRQYSGYLQHEPENPEMGSDSPVELMLPERVWEAPTAPARTTDKTKRKSKAMSLFFDQGIGMWLPKR
ncbi:hypothetical protein LTR37_005434 [Vermiconidia calcicola]|uniref:Uncharacterized protein n=1 Tax=Vermiconidia calcicola TaxID=1690605 RepID=A0ACC3NJN3_9PEZI|nr:hypothetical protein LTR37_005434 [Vermiconidia calcicola]